MPARPDTPSIRFVSFEELKRKIEGFAPNKDADSKKRRQALYDKLRKLTPPRDTKSDGDDAGLFILRALVWFKLQVVQPEEKLAQATSRYWKERKKIEQQVERIRQHPLVRSCTITFHEPSAEVDCPHGRPRSRCERIYSLLVNSQEIEGSRLSPLLTRAMQKRREEIDKELRNYNVNRATARPEDFCVPQWQDPAFPAIEPKKQPGRPRDLFHEGLLESLISCLRGTGLSLKESCELLSCLFRDCLGETVTAGALAKAWQRLPKTEQEKRIGRL